MLQQELELLGVLPSFTRASCAAAGRTFLSELPSWRLLVISLHPTWESSSFQFWLTSFPLVSSLTGLWQPCTCTVSETLLTTQPYQSPQLPIMNKPFTSPGTSSSDSSGWLLSSFASNNSSLLPWPACGTSTEEEMEPVASVWSQLSTGVPGITVGPLRSELSASQLSPWLELFLSTWLTNTNPWLAKMVPFTKSSPAPWDAFSGVSINMSNLLLRTLLFKSHFTTRLSAHLPWPPSSSSSDTRVDSDLLLSSAGS